MLKKFISTFALSVLSIGGVFAQEAIENVFGGSSSDYIKIEESEIGFSPSKNNSQAEVSKFSTANADIFLKSVDEALEMYVGQWNGVQQVYIYGTDKLLADATVSQRYVRADFNGSERLLGTGIVRVRGKSADIKSIMFKEGKYLVLDVRDDQGGRALYRGRVELNMVLWEPYFLFLNSDSQADGFYKAINGVTMESVGLKYLEIPQNKFKGFFYMCSSLSKIDDNYSPSHVEEQRDILFDGNFK